LNYIDIILYRQFRFSPSILRIYNRYIEIGAIKKFYKRAFEIINNLDLDKLNRYEKFKKQLIVNKLAIISADLIENTQNIRFQL
jgi:hypothetical protein